MPVRQPMYLPIPKLVTFFNGKEDVSDKILRLSDSFPKGTDIDQSDVEVRVHMYNIRPQYNNPLLRECKPLAEYSWFIEEIRKNQKTMEIGPAVDRAIEDMPEDFAIRAFLEEHQSEVKSMCITEYDEAETLELFKRDWKEEGKEEGIKEGIKLFIMGMLEDSVSEERILDKLQRFYLIDEKEAHAYIAECLKAFKTEQ